MSREARPIVIRRVQPSGGQGHHGGAWKVAYADFVTAMMAFFLLLWLISSASEETKKGLADFFSNATVNIGPPGGVGGVLDGMTVTPSSVPPLPASPFDGQPALPSRPEVEAEAIGLAPDEATGLAPDEEIGSSAARRPAAADQPEASEGTRRERAGFDQAKAAILSALHTSPELRPFKESLLIDETAEGLRIQLLDRERVSMFPVGRADMYPHTRKLLQAVVEAIAGLPNRVSVRGHTDALPFAPGAAYDSWNLSADRANATRLVMTAAGLEASRVADVIGKGDAEPLIPERADDPRNRRISVVLLRGGPAAEAEERGDR
ncbi:MAG TPA: flagellar motor protein MotB [Geminicoccaceae bacterium]|nr:flagellar motor protein MotB [Geminicoccaceae bacterium]